MILFEDEFGLSYSEDVAHTWAPVGRTPLLKRHGRYRRETSTMVALAITGRLFKRHFDGAINANVVSPALGRTWTLSLQLSY